MFRCLPKVDNLPSRKLLTCRGVSTRDFAGHILKNRSELSVHASIKSLIVALCILSAIFACGTEGERPIKSGDSVSGNSKSYSNATDSLERSIKMWDQRILKQHETIAILLREQERGEKQYKEDSMDCQQLLKSYEDDRDRLNMLLPVLEAELKVIEKTIADKQWEKDYQHYVARWEFKMEKILRITNEMKYYQPQISDLQLGYFRSRIEDFREDFERCRLTLPQLPALSTVTEKDFKQSMFIAVSKFDSLSICLEKERQKRREQADLQKTELLAKQNRFSNELQKARNEIESLNQSYELEREHCLELKVQWQEVIRKRPNQLLMEKNFLAYLTSQKIITELRRNELEFAKLELKSSELMAPYNELRSHETALLKHANTEKWDAMEQLSKLVDARLLEFRQSLIRRSSH